ncbi:hypothetical protein C8Q79DRAFT_1011786 [Trametes meyenii]|nr:hypothetical protein C8Q79DRAFT_1011786 [Trametes meyenii]
MSNSTNPNRGESVGAGLGNTLKGAFQTAQGLGDAIRGNAMDFVDSATGTSRRHHEETDVGRAKTEQGINRMETSTTTNPTSTTQPSTTSTAAPPLPPRNNQGGTFESNGAFVGDQQ